MRETRDNYESSSIALANKCRTIANQLTSESIDVVDDGRVAAFSLLMNALSREVDDLSKFLSCLATGILVEMERDTNMGN